MSFEKLSQGPSPHATSSATPRVLWGRPLAVAAAVIFFLLSPFPVVAGLFKSTTSFPKWWGALDVGLAFVLAGMALGVMAAARGKEDRRVIDASYHAYRVVNHGILAMLVGFFLLGDRVLWTQCLTGFAWRAWLLIYVLPAWLATIKGAEAPQNP